MNELDKTTAQQPQVIVPLVDLVQGYIEARDKIQQFDEEYDKNIKPLKEAKEYFKLEVNQNLLKSGKNFPRGLKAQQPPYPSGALPKSSMSLR